MELTDSDVVISNCDFIGNTARLPYGKYGDGGAIGALTLKGSSVLIDNCRFINNSAATNSGGAVALLYTRDSVFEISSSSFTGNVAGSRGGCVYVKQTTSPVIVRDSTFTGCMANGFGGGVSLENTGTTTTREEGEAAYTTMSKGLIATNNTFSLCRAQSGGGIGVTDSFLLAEGNTFLLNSVSEYGNAIYAFRSSSLYDIGNYYSMNAANSGAGGAVLVADADFTPEYVRSHLIPLISNAKELKSMRANSLSVGVRDGSERLLELVNGVLLGKD
jgi:predicted outer membrane repeat protein